MGETAASNAGLEVSISFGRFENDSLSWERWSSFSTNKYLEEVEKCATPGSVAEKKAYFEAHYKKIAARKAELTEQEKQAEIGLFKSDADNNRGGDVRSIIEDNYKIDASAELNLARRMEQVSLDIVMRQEMETDKDDYEIDASSGLNFARGMERVNIVTGMGQEMETSEDDLITIECHSFSAEPERVQDEPSKGEDKLNLNRAEEERVVKEVPEQELIPTIACVAAASAEFQSNIREDAIEHRENADSEMGGNSVLQEENARLNPPGDEIKIVKASKETNTPKIRKKQPSPLLKLPQITTPKVSKPISASATSSASHSSTRARTAQSTTRTKNLNTPSTDSSKKVAPKSLRKSFSPSPASAPASAPAATRKSFIMDSMGDKDIVKRAFKMFQSNARKSDLPGDDKSPVSKQVAVPSSRTGLSASHSIITRKENGGATSGAAVQRVPRASPPSFGLRSNEKPSAVPQHVKKFQEKPNAKGQEKTNLQLKLEEDKEAGIKTLRQGLNFKAASSPASRRQSKMKNIAGKGGL